jgi:hypothetical protein
MKLFARMTARRSASSLSEQTGKGYQTLINEALSAPENDHQLTASQIKILREELAEHAAG